MTIRPLAVAAAAIAIAFATPPLYAVDTPSAAPAKVTVAERLASARKSLDAKDFSRAMRELDAVVKEDPNNADAHNLLGYSWRKRPNPDLVKAIDHYQTALKISPNHRGVHEYIGEAYLMKKDTASAEKHLAELERICGNRSCEEYQDLAKSIAEFKAKN